MAWLGFAPRTPNCFMFITWICVDDCWVGLGRRLPRRLTLSTCYALLPSLKSKSSTWYDMVTWKILLHHAAARGTTHGLRHYIHGVQYTPTLTVDHPRGPRSRSGRSWSRAAPGWTSRGACPGGSHESHDKGVVETHWYENGYSTVAVGEQVVSDGLYA